MLRCLATPDTQAAAALAQVKTHIRTRAGMQFLQLANQAQNPSPQG
jgi:hypothetical protein